MRILRDDRPIRMVDSETYEVPSQSSAGYYRVGLATDPADEGWQRAGFTADFCTCPYHKRGTDESGDGLVCKHIYALRLYLRGLRSARDGASADPRPRHKNPAQYDSVKAKEKRGVRELIRSIGADLFPGADDVIPATAREAGRAA
jgi:hypothetical protein